MEEDTKRMQVFISSSVRPTLLKLGQTEEQVTAIVCQFWHCVANAPKLLQCYDGSIAMCLRLSAMWGLRLGFNGEAWLIPRRNNKKSGRLEANFQTGYLGLVKLAHESNKLTKIEARVVYDGDDFRYEYGTKPFVRHIPTMETRGNLKACYAVAVFTNGFNQFEVMTLDDIAPIVNKADKSQPSWKDYESEMWKRSALNRLCKLLPGQTDELATSVYLNEQANAEVPQNLESASGVAPEASGESATGGSPVIVPKDTVPNGVDLEAGTVTTENPAGE